MIYCDLLSLHILKEKFREHLCESNNEAFSKYLYAFNFAEVNGERWKSYFWLLALGKVLPSPGPLVQLLCFGCLLPSEELKVDLSIRMLWTHEEPCAIGVFPKCIEQHIAAAAKSLPSCPILCDPIDGSPPGSPVPGILQARTLEISILVDLETNLVPAWPLLNERDWEREREQSRIEATKQPTIAL